MHSSLEIEYIAIMSKTVKLLQAKNIWLLTASIMLSACVSDTFSEVDTQSQQLAEPEKTPKYDPVQREQAIAEIRAKNAQPSSGQLTNAYTQADGPNKPFTAQQQANKTQQLKNTAAQNNAIVTDSELAAKQASIRELQKKAQSHYGNAVNQIQN